MISLHNVKKMFGSRTVLRDISLDILSDEITFIVGTSGAGKTTLLNIVGGLLRADFGSISLDGNDITRDINKYRAKEVGFVFQDFNLINGLSIEKNIEVGQLYAGKSYDQKKREDTNRFLKELNLIEKKQKVETLSGGEKQRVAFARSIIKGSRVIIADEPTGNLDSENADIVLSLLASNKVGRHIIVVSHDMEKALIYADRIIRIDNGSIVDDFRPQKRQLCEDSTVEIINGEENEDKCQVINLKAMRILGHNSFKRHIGRMLSIVAVIAIAISAMTIMFWLRNVTNKVNTNVNKYYLESDLVSVVPRIKEDKKYWTSCEFFTDTQIEYLMNLYPSSFYVTQYYSDPDNLLFAGNGVKTCNTNFKLMSMEDEFIKRFQAYEIEGEIPHYLNEVVISEDVAEELFKGKGIGETLYIYTNSGQHIETKIVGINHTKSATDSYYTFVCAESIKQLRKQEIEMILDNCVVINPSAEGSEILKVGIKGKLCEVAGTEKLIAGTLPVNNYQIVISSYIAESCFGINWEEKFDDISRMNLYIDLNGFYDVEICGVYDDDELLILGTSGLMSEIETPKAAGVDIYLSSGLSAENVCDELLESENYWASFALASLKSQINNETRMLRITNFMVGIVLSLISFAMLNSFSKISLLERSHELAIIKCLGAKNSDLIAVLMYDSFLISILSFLVSFILTAAASAVIPKMLSDIAYVSYNYPLGTECFISLIFMILISVCTLVHFFRITRVEPADLLKEL